MFVGKSKTAPWNTYICNTEEGYEKRGDNNEEGEQLSVLVEAFELVN